MSVFIAPDNPAVEPIGFDLTRTESFGKSLRITDHPVEATAAITDHIIVDPEEFETEVCVSNNPSETNWYGEGKDYDAAIDVFTYKILATFPAFVQTAAEIVKDVLLVRGFGAQREANRVLEMQERLEAIQNAGELCSVLTASKQLDSMVLKDIRRQQGEASEDLGIFRLTWRQIVKVSLHTIAAPKPKEARGNKVVAKGSQSTEEKQVPDDPKQRATLAAQLFPGFLK